MMVRLDSLAESQRPRTRRISVAAILFLAGAFSAQAVEDKYNITSEEHAACDSDAARLCSAAYPDSDKLIACMAANRIRLGPTCQATFVAGMRKRRLPL